MIANKGHKRAAALLLGLMLLVQGTWALADEHMPVAPVETKDTAAERDEGEGTDPAPIQPVSTPTPPPEPTPTPEPAATEAPKPADAPKPEADSGAVEPVAPQLVVPPKPEAEPDAKEYSVSWSQGAFASQTVNFQDELVLGLGATYTIDTARDIQILVSGAKPKGKIKGLSITYQSSNNKYMSVTSSGKLKGTRRGAAQLFVTVQLPDGNQKQLRKNVKIVDAPKIRFAPDSAVLEDGAKLDLSQFAKSPILMVSPNVNAGISYSIAAMGNPNGSQVSLDKKTGKLSVSYSRPGDAYVVTAKTYGGERATFTIYLGQRTQRIEILVSQSAVADDGRVAVQAGCSLLLKAVAYDMTGDLAARQDITWAIIGGGQYASIDAAGQFTANANVDQERSVIVAAMASDGSGASAQVGLLVLP